MEPERSSAWTNERIMAAVERLREERKMKRAAARAKVFADRRAGQAATTKRATPDEVLAAAISAGLREAVARHGVVTAALAESAAAIVLEKLKGAGAPELDQWAFIRARPWFRAGFKHPVVIGPPATSEQRMQEYADFVASSYNCGQVKFIGAPQRMIGVTEMTAETASATIYRDDYHRMDGPIIYAAFTIDGQCRYVGKSLRGMSRPLARDHHVLSRDMEWSVLLIWLVNAATDKELSDIEAGAIHQFLPVLNANIPRHPGEPA